MCRSTATFSFELRYKYNVRFILGHKDASRLKSALLPARASPKHENIFRAKNNVVRRQMQTYSTAKPSSDSILRVQKYSGIKPVKVYRLQNHSAFRGELKASSIKVFLLLRRRTGRCDKLVQIDSASNPSGSSNECLHEGSEVMLLSIGHLEGRQLFLSCVFAVNTD